MREDYRTVTGYREQRQHGSSMDWILEQKGDSSGDPGETQ